MPRRHRRAEPERVHKSGPKRYRRRDRREADKWSSITRYDREARKRKPPPDLADADPDFA